MFGMRKEGERMIGFQKRMYWQILGIHHSAMVLSLLALCSFNAQIMRLESY